MRAKRLLQLSILILACCTSAAFCGRSETASSASRTQAAPQALDAAGAQELNAILTSARLSDLQWPNFSEHADYVKSFYQDTNNQLGWSRDGKPTPQALALIQILEQAELKGLNSTDYDGARWPDRLTALQKNDSSSALVHFDVALTVAAIRYLSDLHLGKVDPRTLHKDFDPERHKHDPGSFLAKDVINADNVQQALVKVEPPFLGYQRALVALQKYIELSKQEKLDPLSIPAKPVKPGQDYPELDKLVRRLQFLGNLPASFVLPQGSTTYSGEVVQAVKGFQLRHGFDPQGALGQQTIEALNRPLSDRVQQLSLMLERWRWLPHQFVQPPVVVNIPEFALRAYDADGKVALTMPVVVGRAMRSETPVMAEDMKYLIFWPYWNVPPSILRHEMVPKITKDPAYLQRNGFEVATYSGEVVTDGVVSEDVLVQLRAGKLTVRQKPGPKNALGLVKFIFPNNNNVYLHSTPAPELFSLTRRDFSHGCIRVEDPQALAVWVLRNNPGWTQERVEAAFKAGKQQQVNLTQEIPVLIVYGTAIVKEDGQTYFFDDLYGFDQQLGKLFAQAYATRN
jgi:L,D-transpeptidase YcbB